jgi:pimeloyl-ACP methyl ester carboxylesterase
MKKRDKTNKVIELANKRVNRTIKNLRLEYLLTAGLALFACLVLWDNAIAGGYVTADKANKVEIYYEEAGEGQPIVFVPGWTMTTRYFKRQLAHYENSKSARFIVFDPRAHGRSTKTLEGVNYIQHARDLKQFIEELGLKDVVMGGHGMFYDHAEAFNNALDTFLSKLK